VQSNTASSAVSLPSDGSFDERFDDIWQELLITNTQSCVDASSDRCANQKASHKSMAIWQ
jgi:hypothetical protein